MGPSDISIEYASVDWAVAKPTTSGGDASGKGFNLCLALTAGAVGLAAILGMAFVAWSCWLSCRRKVKGTDDDTQVVKDIEDTSAVAKHEDSTVPDVIVDVTTNKEKKDGVDDVSVSTDEPLSEAVSDGTQSK